MKNAAAFAGFVILAGLIVLGVGCDKKLETVAMSHVGWVGGSPAGGYGLILHTTDGGATWVRQGDSLTIPSVNYSGLSAVDAQNVWATGNPSQGGYGVILRTTDGGATWARQGDTATVPNVPLDVSAVDVQTAWAAGGDGVILKTSDGGVTWVRQDQGMWPDVAFTQVHAQSRDLVWVGGTEYVGQRTGVWVVRTTDGGSVWERQGQADLPDSSGLIGLHAANASTIWVVGTDNMCFLSTDGGGSWSAKRELASPGDGPHNNNIFVLDDHRAWMAVDFCGAYFTHNAGHTWTELQTPPPNRGSYCVNLGVTAVHEDTVWMTSSSTGPGQILNTTDGGATWTEQYTTDTLGHMVGLRGITFVGTGR